MPSPRPAPQDRRSGFALLITITLVAFLVLILVSLAAFTRVETQVASNNQQHLQARQNALMALNVALGQLQLTLGPDQRVSAPASQKGDGVRNYGAQDLDNNGNWVGVYRQNPNPAVTARDPQLLNWLVSGNQNLSIPASTANTPPVQPGATVAGLAKTMSALTPVSVGDRDAILLVGPGSTMAESAATAPDSVVDNFVVAPLEDIQVPAGSLPGFSPGSTTLTTIGRFAYWVGDENIKAKVSLADPGASPTATSDQQSYRLKVAQRSGIELVESADGTPLSTNYPANAEELMKVLDLKQLPMSDTGGGQSALNEAAKNRFHDLTATSYSLLSDTARGGLKKDLTTWLANSTGLPATAPADDDFITPPHSTDTTGYGLPRWGLVRSYAGIASGVARAPQQQTATQHGFHPIITYFRMGLSASCDEDTPANPTPRLRIHVFPVVVLWNPHDTPIAPAQYEVAYGSRFNTSTSVFIRSAAGDGADPGWQVPANINKGSIRMTTATMNDTTPSAVTNGPQDARRYFRFLVDCTEPIPPGESRVFTLDSSGLYTAGTPGNLPNRMSAHTDYRKDNSAYFEHPALTMTASDIWVDAVADRKSVV